MPIFKTENRIIRSNGVQLRTPDVLYWDPNASAGVQDGSGTWNASNTWWVNSKNISWIPNAVAIIGNGGGGTGNNNISITSPISVDRIILRSLNTTTTKYLLGFGTDNKTITLKNGIIRYSGNGQCDIVSPIVLAGNQTWINNGTGSAYGINSSSIDTNGYNLNFEVNSNKLQIGGTISGSGNITKTGIGILYYTGNINQTYTGKTYILNGDLGTANTTCLIPSGNLILNGGRYAQAFFDSFTRSLGDGNNQVQILSGNSGFSLYANGTWNIIINNDTNYECIWGSQYFNPTVFYFHSSISTATAIISFQNKIDLNGSSRTIYVHGGASNTSAVTFSGIVRNSTGTAGITKTGAGRLSLTSSNTFNGPVTITDGNLFINSDSSLGNSANNIVFNGSHSRLTTTTVDLQINAERTITVNSGCVATMGQENVNGTNIHFRVLGKITGSGSVRVGRYQLGSGQTFFPNSSNDFTGDLIIGNYSTYTSPVWTYSNFIIKVSSIGDAGKIIFGDSANSGTSNYGSFRLLSSSTQSLVLNTRQIQMSDTGTVNTGFEIGNDVSNSNYTLTINTDLIVTSTSQKTMRFTGINTGNNTFAGVISNGSSPAIHVLKLEAGLWILSGANTYTGTTTINGANGTLRLTGSLTSNVTITAGTFSGNNNAGGSASTTGTVTVANTDTAIIRPGISGSSTLNTGALTFSGSSSRMIVDLTTTTMSKIAVTGNVALGGCGIIFTTGTTPNPGIYKIITSSGTMSGTLPAIITQPTLPNGKTATLQQNGNDLEVVIPA